MPNSGRVGWSFGNVWQPGFNSFLRAAVEASRRSLSAVSALHSSVGVKFSERRLSQRCGEGGGRHVYPPTRKTPSQQASHLRCRGSLPPQLSSSDLGSETLDLLELEKLAMSVPGAQDYFRSASNESSAYMVVPTNARRDAPSRLWVAMVLIAVVVLQVACTTGLFLYLNASVSQVKSQGMAEELRCLGLLNALDKDQEIPLDLAPLLGETCVRLAEGIRAYISKVEARTMPRTFNTTGSKFIASAAQRPSAHLTLRDSQQGSSPQIQTPQVDLHQSCRHPLRSWGNQSFGAHLHNMTLSNGRLRVPQDGRYYLYSQVYFRHQLVQCVYKKTSYLRPIQLLKGVGTKCWAPDAEYALHSVHQGGLFELRAGDEVFVSVSSPTMVHADDSSSYFGAFRLDL
ncbi:tumor necrosis factor ligand superfamily member 10-like [Scleropages formosus]|uniref:Tumor necrosis factor ligand superfamily member 10 n=1 Tax=Scleropages formosus TaxID=113540 RepID=A0A0P7TNS0_SCLFO|nr:tumor necrosis factor ligand superfamily member 10-like [Scleropages formosus]